MNGNDYLSSTELLGESEAAWRPAGQLISPLTGLRGLNLQNKIFVTGEFYLLIHKIYCDLIVFCRRF